MKILVIQQKMIGDVLTSSILFEALRNEYPEAQLHYLVQPHTVAVLKNNPYIDKIILDRQDQNGNTLSFLAFAKKLRHEQYDFVIDVYSKIGSAFYAGLSQAKIRIGYTKWYTQPVYTHTTTYERKTKTKAGLAIENRLKLLQFLKPDFPAEIKPKIYLSENELANAREFLEQNKLDLNQPIIMTGLLGSAAEKTYPLEYLADLMEQVVTEKPNAQILLNYIPKQGSEVVKFLDYCSEELRSHIYPEVYASGLREFIALVSLCTAFVGNEGGAVNMAKAVNTPTFSIYSPWIDREAWDSYSGKEHVAAHLKDFKPRFYKDIGSQELKTRSSVLYHEFKPDLLKDKLRLFLSRLD